MVIGDRGDYRFEVAAKDKFDSCTFNIDVEGTTRSPNSVNAKGVILEQVGLGSSRTGPHHNQLSCRYTGTQLAELSPADLKLAYALKRGHSRGVTWEPGIS